MKLAGSTAGSSPGAPATSFDTALRANQPVPGNLLLPVVQHVGEDRGVAFHSPWHPHPCYCFRYFEGRQPADGQSGWTSTTSVRGLQGKESHLGRHRDVGSEGL